MKRYRRGASGRYLHNGQRSGPSTDASHRSFEIPDEDILPYRFHARRACHLPFSAYPYCAKAGTAIARAATRQTVRARFDCIKVLLYRLLAESSLGYYRLKSDMTTADIAEYAEFGPEDTCRRFLLKHRNLRPPRHAFICSRWRTRFGSRSWQWRPRSSLSSIFAIAIREDTVRESRNTVIGLPSSSA